MFRILFFTLVLLATSASAKELVLPQLASGPDWSTTILLSSFETSPVNLELRFYKPDGTPWKGALLQEKSRRRFCGADEDGRMALRIGETWTVELELPRSDFLKTGYMKVDTGDKEILITAFHCYYKDGCQRETARIGFAAATPFEEAAAMVVSSDSAIALANPTSQPITLLLQANVTYENFGAVGYHKTIDLDANQQISFFVIPELAADPFFLDVPVVGHLTINGSDSFSAMGVLFPRSGVFSSVPLVPFSEKLIGRLFPEIP